MLLCVTLVLGLVLPSGVRANDASKIYEAAELATGGVPLVPAALLEDLSFMGDYVENGGSMSLNSLFSRYKTENADGAGDTLPNGVIDGHQSKAWYASYRWSATREQRDVINRPDVELRFSGIHTTVDTYTVYVANDAAYKIVTDADGGTVYRIPMVEGRNLIVYEIQSTNGVITTHEMVVDVSVKAEEWELSHEVTCAGDTENAISAEVWPVGLLGEALDLNESDTLDRNRYNFRETESRGGFVSSYTYERDVEDVEYFLVDRYGNISAKTLTIRDDYGNVRTIDSSPGVDRLYDGSQVSRLCRYA